jgi:hypothetical protein
MGSSGERLRAGQRRPEFVALAGHETPNIVRFTTGHRFFGPIFTPPNLLPFSHLVDSMKTLLLLPLLTLATAVAAPAAFAQAQATVKTKVKPATGEPSVKTKTTVSAAAPTAPPSDEQIEARANALTANMQKNLGLTPQQTEKVRVINRRSVELVENTRFKYRAEPRKMMPRIDDISESRLSQLKDVLAPAQFDKYQRKREEKMGLPSTQAAQGTPPPGMGGDQ